MGGEEEEGLGSAKDPSQRENKDEAHQDVLKWIHDRRVLLMSKLDGKVQARILWRNFCKTREKLTIMKRAINLLAAN